MKILVADDDRLVLKALSTLLDQSDFAVTCVGSGGGALTAAEREEFDLALLDVHLPDMSGIEACQRLKAQCDHFLPIILVTGRDGAEGKIDGLESGADDYVLKPFNNRELLARVKALLRIKVLHDEVRHLASMREQIVYTVSHDFRTPLVGIRGAIQNLLKGLVGPMTDKQKEYLVLVDQATKRLSELTDQMGKAARKLGGKQKVDRGEVEVKKAVETAVAGLRPEIVKRRIDFVVDTDAEAPAAWANQDGLTQVLANLLDNAVKHSPEQGRIEVGIRGEMTPRGPGVHLTVGDEGPGIARSDFERIFYRFEQVGDPEDTKNLGTGLGLAICKEIVESHGGKIWVESEPPGGARFHVQLPATIPVRGVA